MAKSGKYNTETGLTRKQEKLVQEYVKNGFNATQAGIKAGYSPESAYQIASNTLKIVEVQKYLNSLIKSTVTEEFVLNKILELQNLAQNDNKLNEALKATELLGKYLAMFTDKNVVQNETLEDVILKMDEKRKNSDKVNDNLSNKEVSGKKDIFSQWN